MHIIVYYRGCVTDSSVAKVRVRVVEEPELPGGSRIYQDVMQSKPATAQRWRRRRGCELRVAGNTALRSPIPRPPTIASVPKLSQPVGTAHASDSDRDGESASDLVGVLQTSAAKAPFAVISGTSVARSWSAVSPEGLTRARSRRCCF